MEYDLNRSIKKYKFGNPYEMSNRTLWAEENADCFRRLCG